jgi:hypothetical protein
MTDGYLLAEAIQRASDAERYERWIELVAHTGYCRHPVRLRGSVTETDLATGELRSRYSTAAEPEGVLLKACGNRRAAACPSCSATYKGDAWQLVAAGVRGGKGVPETVVQHPMVFVTFTAPSFGAVHTATDPNYPPAACRPRRAGEMCRHGRWASCWQTHADDDPLLGDPICAACFDYEGAVIWNARAPELWRRTTIYIRRALARIAGVTQTRLAEEVSVAYTKVAEYQRRGLLHFHAVIRLDAAGDAKDAVVPPPAAFTAALLDEAVRSGAAEVFVPHPLDESALRWGEQLHLRPIAPEGETAPEAAAAYLAKYATKSADDLGLHDGAATREHVARLQETVKRLAMAPALADLHLSRAVDPIGFRGHWSTRSRRYSTTFAALRQARVEHARAGADTPESPNAEILGDWRYAGLGYTTAGDAWLAASAGDANREQRQAAKLELRTEGRA